MKGLKEKGIRVQESGVRKTRVEETKSEMRGKRFSPKRIYIDEDCGQYPLTKRILAQYPDVPQTTVKDRQRIFADLNDHSDPIGEGKQCLYLTRQKGEFVKPCPCTQNYIGCGYFIINLDLNCPLDCTYCVLQNYLSNPCLTIHVNTDKLWRQLDMFLDRHPAPLRIGTGELGDSLALDHITGRSSELIEYFRGKPNAQLELKTKTVNISGLLDTRPAENIIPAWSLNADRIARSDEKGAPPVEARLQAAREVIERGFRVAFHFDPIVRFSGWENEYYAVITALASYVPAERIAWISLGSLRFPAALKPVIQERFPQSRLLYEEFIPGKDGKLRYFRPLRHEQYKAVINRICRDLGSEVPLYFCMEGKSMWRALIKKEPRDEVEIARFLSSPLGSG